MSHQIPKQDTTDSRSWRGSSAPSPAWFAERTVNTGVRGPDSERRCANLSGAGILYLFPFPECRRSTGAKAVQRTCSEGRAFSGVLLRIVTSPSPKT